MSAERNLYRQSRSMARSRLHHQHTPNTSCTVFDRDRTQAQPVQFVAGIAAREAEAFAVIVDDQNNFRIILPQFYHDMRGPSMLFYVVQCFSVNLKQFTAYAIRQVQDGGIDQQIERHGRFIAEALSKS